MFHSRISRMQLRKPFEDRVWSKGESFGDYVHDKTILANRVPVEEEDRMDYFIEGIPDRQLRYQTRNHQFRSFEELLAACEKIFF